MIDVYSREKKWKWKYTRKLAPEGSRLLIRKTRKPYLLDRGLDRGDLEGSLAVVRGQCGNMVALEYVCIRGSQTLLRMFKGK
jgi:hypothetical protein